VIPASPSGTDTWPLVAIVPVKGLAQAKSRLASVLSESERRSLVLDLLDHTLSTIRESGVIAATLVVTPDDETLQLAARSGAVPIREVGRGYNRALDQGRREALGRYPDAGLLVLAADLPCLEPAELTMLAELALDPRSIVIAPDAAARGTNALAGWPVRWLGFHFGTDSLSKHIALAEDCGLRIHLYHAPGTVRDLDTPEDLCRLPTGPAFSACR
jgi:2-phospho-L-lactate guanylyltransferase